MLNTRIATIAAVIIVILAVVGIYFYIQGASKEESRETATSQQNTKSTSPSPTKAVLPEFSAETLPKTGAGGDCNSCREYLTGETLNECLAYLNCSE